jgi:hypothetical protein
MWYYSFGKVNTQEISHRRDVKMKVKINIPRTLPRDYKVHGWDVKTWEALNSGKAVEVDAIPSEYDALVKEVKAEGTSASVVTKPSAKKGAK